MDFIVAINVSSEGQIYIFPPNFATFTCPEWKKKKKKAVKLFYCIQLSTANKAIEVAALEQLMTYLLQGTIFSHGLETDLCYLQVYIVMISYSCSILGHHWSPWSSWPSWQRWSSRSAWWCRTSWPHWWTRYCWPTWFCRWERSVWRGWCCCKLLSITSH